MKTTKTIPTPGSKAARATSRAQLKRDLAAHHGMSPTDARKAATLDLCARLRAVTFKAALILALALGAVSGNGQGIQVTVQGRETRQEVKQRIINTRSAVREIIAEDEVAERAARAEMARQYRIAQQERAARTAALMAAQAKAHAAWVKQQREQHDITHAAARQAYRAERAELREHQRTNTIDVRMAAYWASLTNRTEAAKLP